jgi:hypothetical protein
MRRNLLSAGIGLTLFFASIGIVPKATAAANDNTNFNLVQSSGAVSCLKPTARGRATISDLGQVQNLHVEVFALPANTQFTLFVINTPAAPFVPAWYQGDVTTDARGNGVVDVTGIFSDETFILNPGTPAVPTELTHLGLWFADPADAVKAGCADTVTPFDGDHEAGIQVLNTSNFADANGPLKRIQ